MPVLTAIWMTLDANACPICIMLSGYQWIFYREDIKKARVPRFLAYPGRGVVWNISSGLSHAHGGVPGGNCRCSVNFMFSLEDYADSIRSLRLKLEASLT